MPRLVCKNNLAGKVKIPASKSITHRALICSALAATPSRISNIVYSNDILATIACLRSLGTEIIEGDNYVEVIPHKIHKIDDLDALESGSTLRFMIPLMLLQPEKIKITGHNRLKERPLGDYINIFNDFKINYSYNGSLPLELEGSLRPGKYYLSGDKSSQFITGLLFALPLLKKDSEIILLTPLESVEYVNMTIKILKQYGIHIDVLKNGYYIKGKQKYHSFDYVIPGDFSQAAFFLVANSLGANLELEGLVLDHMQGDEKILAILNQMGVSFDEKYLALKRDLKPITISLKDEPDLAPILAAMATSIEGETILKDLKRLEYKESDRLLATKELILKIGGNCFIENYNLHILGKTKYHSAKINVYNDHRILMTSAIMAMLCQELEVDDLKPINKSFPDFFKIYESIGGKAYE